MYVHIYMHRHCVYMYVYVYVCAYIYMSSAYISCNKVNVYLVFHQLSTNNEKPILISNCSNYILAVIYQA